MSQRRLRDDLRDVFDSLSEPAHPALASRIRREIEERAATPRPTPRFAVAVAALVAGLVVAGLLLAGHGIVRPPGTPAGRATSTPAPAPSPSAVTSPTPIASAQATPTPASTPAAVLPGFSCAAQSGGAGTAGLTGVRAAAQTGFDRFVIQFDGPVPPYQVVPQSSATFTTDPQGSPAPLAGTAGLRVTVDGVGNWTSLGGPTDLRPAGTPELQEARQLGAFEGVVTWGLGLARPACFRAYTLTGPNRLVVDVQA
jgi:hypothetical protein